MPAIAFLAAALVCAFIGRILLVTAAFGVSVGWGLTVLFVPFGPLFFRMNYKELAHPTRYWRLATGPLLLLFFLNGGTGSVSSFFHQFGKQDTAEEASAGDTHFHLPNPSKIIASLKHADSPAEANAATPSAMPAKTAATPASPGATPSKAVAASVAAMVPAPKVLSVAERVEANRREFERLSDWYENLRRERGYLRKGDTPAVEAYNAEAAKYQAALQLAKTEQAELTKLKTTAQK
jgi:hypothetical protein